jgi:hypothetical protein
MMRAGGPRSKDWTDRSPWWIITKVIFRLAGRLQEEQRLSRLSRFTRHAFDAVTGIISSDINGQVENLETS